MGPVRPAPRRGPGAGGGGGALDSILRVLGAPPLANVARSPPRPWVGHRFLGSSSTPSSHSSVHITELVADKDVTRELVGDSIAPPTAVAEPERRSARLALLEGGSFEDMQAKAVKRRALRDALIGCSPCLQAKAARDKVLDVVVVPLATKTVAGIRSAAAIKTSVVTAATDG